MLHGITCRVARDLLNPLSGKNHKSACLPLLQHCINSKTCISFEFICLHSNESYFLNKSLACIFWHNFGQQIVNFGSSSKLTSFEKKVKLELHWSHIFGAQIVPFFASILSTNVHAIWRWDIGNIGKLTKACNRIWTRMA